MRWLRSLENGPDSILIRSLQGQAVLEAKLRLVVFKVSDEVVRRVSARSDGLSLSSPNRSSTKADHSSLVGFWAVRIL